MDWKGKPRLATVKDVCCGKCTHFRTTDNPDKGWCGFFMYVPDRYPNQVCVNFRGALMDKPAFENPFHDHLDVCQRCRNQPFNLCNTGAKLLQETAQKLAEDLPFKFHEFGTR